MIRLEGTDATYDKRGDEKGKFKWDHSSHLVQDTQQTRDEYEMQKLRTELYAVLAVDYNQRFNLKPLSKEQLVRITKTMKEVHAELKPAEKK